MIRENKKVQNLYLLCPATCRFVSGNPAARRRQTYGRCARGYAKSPSAWNYWFSLLGSGQRKRCDVFWGHNRSKVTRHFLLYIYITEIIIDELISNWESMKGVPCRNLEEYIVFFATNYLCFLSYEFLSKLEPLKTYLHTYIHMFVCMCQLMASSWTHLLSHV